MKILKWCRQLSPVVAWLLRPQLRGVVARFLFLVCAFVVTETLPTLTLKVTPKVTIWWTQDGFLDAPMILMPIVSSWITAILPGFSSEEKSNLTSIDGWGSPGLSDFPVKFCWGNKVWRSKWISQSTILNVCLKNSVESKSKSLQKVNEDWCLHHLKMHGYMALVPGCWLSLAIDMTSSTHTSLASIQL